MRGGASGGHSGALDESLAFRVPGAHWYARAATESLLRIPPSGGSVQSEGLAPRVRGDSIVDVAESTPGLVRSTGVGVVRRLSVRRRTLLRSLHGCGVIVGRRQGRRCLLRSEDLADWIDGQA